MKRIEFIAPVESMRGNLSGAQALEYAENNNPAYEAPNGVQYARNYQPRFIGAKRGADGLKYFAVRTKTATNLKPSTRRAMAIVGVTAAIRSALMKYNAADYATMQQAFEYIKAQGLLPEGQNTFKKWFDANVKQMLVYKRATWSFTQAGISFTLHNPYKLDASGALVIKNVTWVKFANIFAFSAAPAFVFANISIDAHLLFVASDDALDMASAKEYVNPNMVTSLAAVTISEGATPEVQYNAQTVYTPAGVVLRPITVLVAGTNYTTAAPLEP